MESKTTSGRDKQEIKYLDSETNGWCWLHEHLMITGMQHDANTSWAKFVASISCLIIFHWELMIPFHPDEEILCTKQSTTANYDTGNYHPHSCYPSKVSWLHQFTPSGVHTFNVLSKRGRFAFTSWQRGIRCNTIISNPNPGSRRLSKGQSDGFVDRKPLPRLRQWSLMETHLKHLKANRLWTSRANVASKSVSSSLKVKFRLVKSDYWK